MSYIHQLPYGRIRGHALGVLLLCICCLSWPRGSQAQIDICGCIGHPNIRGAFDTTDPQTYPPGTMSAFRELTIPLPANGILIFSSLTVRPRASDASFITVRFVPNAENTPVTLLVTGDVTITSGATLSVNGSSGISGSAGMNGTGGLGGPGGFRGGDGAYPLMNFANHGGAGFGPGGGAAGTATPLQPGGNGLFIGVPQIPPLVGGSGGGGGASNSTTLSCSAGGGGGGGGALLLAANGTLTVNGTISADGGVNAGPFTSCTSGGGHGSGGAIRLLANAIAGTGSLSANSSGGNASKGAIRLEAFTNTIAANLPNPVASRAPAPGPLANPLMPTVAIIAVGGEAVPMPPQGVFGGIDLILPAPGVVNIDLATSGVPHGTTVEVTVKPRVGGPPVSLDAPLTNCSAAGDCTATVAFNLLSGSYVIEAQATYQTP